MYQASWRAKQVSDLQGQGQQQACCHTQMGVELQSPGLNFDAGSLSLR